MKLFILDNDTFTTKQLLGSRTVRIKRSRRRFQGLVEIKPTTWHVEVIDQYGKVVSESEVQTLELADHITASEALNLVLHSDDDMQLLNVVTRPLVAIDLTSIVSRSPHWRVDTVQAHVLNELLRWMNMV